MNYQLVKDWSLIVGLGILSAVVQMAGFNPLGFWWADLNLAVVIIVIAAMIVPFERLLVLAFVAGLVLDLYAGLPFGLLTFLLLISAAVAYLLLSTVFTNRSLYTLLVLILIVTLFYQVCQFILIQATNVIGMSDVYLGWSYWRLVVHQLAANAVVAAIIFYALNRLSRWFKPIFIRS